MAHPIGGIVQKLNVFSFSAIEREARNPDIFLLTVVLFEKIEILIEKTKPDILHQIAKSRNPDWILFDYARALGPVL